jgi:LysR family transcriptional regulator, chromosome initiation inhibitor
MALDSAQLTTFAAVVSEGSFEAAARTLHVTPSAVSQRVKSLERRAGRVLVRRARPVEVTDAGEAYLRLARQVVTLVRATRAAVHTADGSAAAGRPDELAIAVNSDSIPWVLPALTSVAHDRAVVFDLRREDEHHSAGLLRRGEVTAAITTSARAVQGCRVSRLGVMRYRAVASLDFVARWFPDGVTADALGIAPVLDFDRKDELQSAFIRRITRRRVNPPRHYLPSTADFATAVHLGLGWGMLTPPQSHDGLRSGDLVDLGPVLAIDVALYWQQWSVSTTTLDAVAQAVHQAAAEVLVPSAGRAARTGPRAG